MKKIAFLLVAFFFLFFGQGCSKIVKRIWSKPLLVQDSSVYSNQDYSDVILDSAYIRHYLSNDSLLIPFAEDILSFYSRRNFQAAWFVNGVMTNSTDAFFGMLNEYQSNFGDSSLYSPQRINWWNAAKSDSSYFEKNKVELLKFELGLTTTFFQYVKKAYFGTDKDPKDLEWFIPRKKKDYLHLLDTLVMAPDAYQLNEPINNYYKLLKQALIKYRTIENSGGLPYIAYNGTLRKGDTNAVVLILKSYLRLTGDFTISDSSFVFTDSLTTALQHFQIRMGIRSTGSADSFTVNEMNVPIRLRIKQMMLNMERMRWLPDQTPDNYFLVNIPEYMLHIFEDKHYKWSMNVVVGKAATATSIFSGNLSVVGFCPYWNVPQSIIKNEMLPRLKANPGYINRNNLEVLKNGRVVSPYSIVWSKYKNGVPFVIRQKPGPSNALGLVAFYFPNSFDIYLHDTPAKSYFEETKRAFSHGCIRLSDPEKLALYVFRNDSVNFPPDSIRSLMHGNKERKVRVKPSIPVYIGYFTAWVNHNGKLNFRPDIYGLDEKLETEVFGKTGKLQ